MIHSAEKRAMSASATVLAYLGRAQAEELPHTRSPEAHRRDLTGFCRFSVSILDRFRKQYSEKLRFGWTKSVGQRHGYLLNELSEH